MDRPEISEALAHNRHLRTLDLSWNGMGNEGVMCLANALRGNRRLEFLDLTHVEMKERGAMVMADVLKEDKTLATVLLNENPIGQRGGRAVLRAMRKMVEYLSASIRRAAAKCCVSGAGFSINGSGSF